MSFTKHVESSSYCRILNVYLLPQVGRNPGTRVRYEYYKIKLWNTKGETAGLPDGHLFPKEFSQLENH